MFPARPVRWAVGLSVSTVRQGRQESQQKSPLQSQMQCSVSTAYYPAQLSTPDPRAGFARRFPCSASEPVLFAPHLVSAVLRPLSGPVSAAPRLALVAPWPLTDPAS